MFSISLQPISCWLRGFFAFCSSFQFIFMFSILYLLNKEDFHYEHHYRHRPRLLRYQNSALFISGWTYQLRRTRTLHPPRTLRVWRVLFVCGSGRQPIQRDKTVNDNYYLLTLAAIAKRNPAARLAARMFCANCGGSAADQFRTRQTQVQRLSAAKQATCEFPLRGRGVQHHHRRSCHFSAGATPPL